MKNIVPNKELLVNVEVKAEVIKQFLEEYRELLNKYGFVTEVTDNHYLIFNLCDLIKLDIKPMYRD